jgi:hypothetical protein
MRHHHFAPRLQNVFDGSHQPDFPSLLTTEFLQLCVTSIAFFYLPQFMFSLLVLDISISQVVVSHVDLEPALARSLDNGLEV